jgi:beta-N-acetylhexosaminidase
MHPALLVDVHGTTLTADERELLAHPGVAGVCLFSRNLAGVEQARELTAALLEAAGRPLVVAIDQEGGGVVRLPQVSVAPSAMALGAADDVALTERLGLATARGLRRIGVNVDFAPVADVQSNPANPVIGDRAFGADPHHVARHVVAFTRGLQAGRVAATLKHFPGHGDVDVDSHLALPRTDADEEHLGTLAWPPFEAGIAAGAAAVMSAHIVVAALDPDTPATLSSRVLEGVLRQRMGFGGVTFSDALDMRAIASHWSVPEAAVRAAAAGIDVPVLCNADVRTHTTVLDALARAVADGRIGDDRVRAARSRLTALLGAYPNATDADDAAEIADDAAAEAEAARRSITAVGAPPRLAAGATAVVFGRAAIASGAASDAARPVAALCDALAAAGVDVRWVTDPSGLAAALAGARALVVATSERTPLDDAAVRRYRDAFAQARATGVDAVHVALWNPAHVSDLPGPALLSYGSRPSSIAAVVAALRSGSAPGRAPVPLAAWSEG